MPHTDPPESTRDAEPAFRRVWRALRSARRRTVAIVAVVAILLVTGLVVLTTSVWSSDGDTDRALATPHTKPDPVPTAKLLTDKDIPEHCGISKATRTKLAPGADDEGDGCRWYSLNAGKDDCDFCPTAAGDRERVLDVSVQTEKGVNDTSPISQAMQDLDTLQTQAAASSIPFRTVTGLGEEAIARYVPGGTQDGGTIVFRYRNALVTVNYHGRDISGKNRRQRSVPKKEAMDAVLRAAAETAGKLDTDVPSKPKITSPSTGPPALTHVPKPCDAVPETTLDQVAPDADRSGQPGSAFKNAVDSVRHNATMRTCTWQTRPTCCADDGSDEGPARNLTVSLVPLPDRSRGSGTREATRVFRTMHRDARYIQTSDKQNNAFRMLTGPGDQAFSTYEIGSDSTADSQARVFFRVRNVLIAVSYSGADDERAISRKQAIDSAYTVAVQVAKSLPT